MLLFISCSSEDDAKINVCSSDCTTLDAQFITKDGEAVEGVKVRIDYVKSGNTINEDNITNLINEASDENGNIFIEFLIDDEYLSDIADAQFRFTIDDSVLDNNEYIRFNNQDGYDSESFLFGIPNTFNKDTIFNIEAFFPKKSVIKVKLNNFEPIQSDDYFRVSHAYPFGLRVERDGFLGSDFRAYVNTNSPFLARSSQTTYDIYVAEGENNLFKTVKQKDGIITTEEFIIEGPSAGENSELTFEY